jgi:hypothetical protein
MLASSMNELPVFCHEGRSFAGVINIAIVILGMATMPVNGTRPIRPHVAIAAGRAAISAACAVT